MPKIDQSPVFPSSVLFRFPGRRCTGTFSDTCPDYYIKTINITDVITSGAPKGTPSPKYYHEYALALFAAGGTTPTNKTALDNLALQFATDMYTWWQSVTNRVYNGVIAIDPTGYYDEIIIDYSLESVTTRVVTAPYNGDVEELMHHDPANAGCTDAANSGNPVSQLPCGEFYGPPSSCSGGHLVITVYKVCIIDGRLSKTYVRQDTIT